MFPFRQPQFYYNDTRKDNQGQLGKAMQQMETQQPNGDANAQVHTSDGYIVADFVRPHKNMIGNGEGVSSRRDSQESLRRCFDVSG